MLDVVSRHARLAFVRDQLRLYSGAKKELSDSTFVQCPWHSEKTPSFRVFHGEGTSVPGYGKCYGCGARSTWDALAVKLRLEPFKPVKPQDEYARDLQIKVDDPVPDDAKGGELELLGDLPRGKAWRSIPTKLLADLGAKLCRMYYRDSDFYTENFIYLPCVVRGKRRGFIRARMKKVKGKPSYLNSSGKWSSTHGLFPLDYAIELMLKTTCTVMVLVEGPRDALRLLRYGIPAVAILGTQSWSDNKTKMLELSGVETVVLMMDGDKAGREATKMIKAAVRMMLNVKVFKLPNPPDWEEGDEGYDPGNCPLEILNDLKRRLRIGN